MTAPRIIRAPRCGGCGQRLELTRRDWHGRDRAAAIAHAIERADWRGKPLRCIPCRRARHREFNERFAALHSTAARGLFP